MLVKQLEMAAHMFIYIICIKFLFVAPQFVQSVAETEGSIGIFGAQDGAVGDMDQLAGVILAEERNEVFVCHFINIGDECNITSPRFNIGNARLTGVKGAWTFSTQG